MTWTQYMNSLTPEQLKREALDEVCDWLATGLIDAEHAAELTALIERA